MASNVTTTTAADSPVSRKRPAEDEAPKAEELQPEGESAVSAPAAADATAENGTDDDGEQQPAKRARKEEEDNDDEKKEEEETKETEAEENKKKEQKAEESGGSGKLAFLGPTGEGFSSFSSFAAGPLSFSSVSSGAADAGAAPLSFNLGAAAGSTPGPFSIDFSSPTPFGSLFGGDGGKDAAATPSLTSTGFTLFSSSSPSTSSDFAFSLSSSSSSLLFSSGAESSSTSVAEKVEVVTGEENEERVHSVRAKLLKLEPESQAWKERGSGQLHLNVAKDRSYARLVMRAEGALRLILNTALFPHTITKRVQEKGVQVSAVEEGKPVLYLLRASRRDEAEELFAAINRHKELGGSSSATSL